MLKYFLLLLSVPMLAADVSDAVVTFSDGSKVSGRLTVMGSRPITINQQKDKRSRDRKIELSDIVLLTQKVEKASMERPWMFKESGKTEKVYFEGEYPLIHFSTEILLVSGEVVRGHIISIPFRFKGNGPSKLFLNRQIKGKNGQKMDDLKYIEKIAFPRKADSSAIGISGSVSGFGTLQEAAAVDRRRHVVMNAEIKGERFVFPNLLPGEYDLFLLTENAVLVGFSGTDQFPETLKRNFNLADDFFRHRRLLLLDGTRTLIYKRRSDFYAAKKHVDGGFLWHLEIWNWHTAGDEWKLDSRDMPLRRMQKGREKKRTLYQMKSLYGISPAASRELTIRKETEHEFIRILD